MKLDKEEKKFNKKIIATFNRSLSILVCFSDERLSEIEVWI